MGHIRFHSEVIFVAHEYGLEAVPGVGRGGRSVLGLSVYDESLYRRTGEFTFYFELLFPSDRFE